MFGRNHIHLNYRYAFNGQEKDDEVVEGAVSFKYRMHDARIGRFLSIDPLSRNFPWNSSYAFAENQVIWAKDLEGGEAYVVIFYKKEGKLLGTSLIKIPNPGKRLDGHKSNPEETLYLTQEVTDENNYSKQNSRSWKELYDKVSTDKSTVFKEAPDTRESAAISGLRERKENFAVLFNKGLAVPFIKEPNLAKVQFKNASAILTDEAKAELDIFVRSLDYFPKSKFTIDAHTSTTGDDDYNQELSNDRAIAVRKYLIGLGVTEYRITKSTGHGETSPLEGVAGENAENRRVEITFESYE